MNGTHAVLPLIVLDTEESGSACVLPHICTPDACATGEVMYQSHASYSAIGLGSPGTDRIAKLVTDCSRNAGGVLYGAKITGGGSGGTVCIIGESNEAGRLAMAQVHSRYKAETGQDVTCFRGSSMGAIQFGHLRIYLKQ